MESVSCIIGWTLKYSCTIGEPLGSVYDNTFVQLFMPLSATKAVIYTVGGGIGQELAIEVTHLVLHQPLVYVAQCDTNLVCFCMLLIKSFFREAIYCTTCMDTLANTAIPEAANWPCMCTCSHSTHVVMTNGLLFWCMNEHLKCTEMLLRVGQSTVAPSSLWTPA